MGNFFTLISIENMKLWKRISAKVMLIIMIVLIVLATGIYKYYTASNHISDTTTTSTTTVTTDGSQNWKQDLQKKIQAEKVQLTQAENSTNKMVVATSVGPMKKTIAEDEYRINNNIKPESKESIWTRVTYFYTNGFSGLVILFTVIACTASVAGEFSEGTMKMMISRPFSRSQILSAKLIAIIIYGIVLVVTTFVLNFLLLGILFGFDGISSKEMIWTSGKISYEPAALKSLILLGLDSLQAIVFIIVAFAISAISRSRSIATGFSIFLVLVGAGIISLLAEFFTWGKYLPFAVTSFASYISSGTAIGGTSLSFAIIISLLYSALFCFLGYFIFQKRDI
ncbi:ABC transporter permease subunit [Clostridium akagii]|uniref:ABC transporter permease subunit n=1 Tax=Clostridium akagii TaxID=91623 RepID=UPI00047A137B|nr:ABC transporter permease subunit [Clostridium akagii]